LLIGFHSQKLFTRKFKTTWKLLHIKVMEPLNF
jgi:hypothetical protein